MNNPATTIAKLDMKELATLLVRAAGKHEGIFWIAVDYGITLGNSDDMQQKEQWRPQIPTAIFQLQSVTLVQFAEGGPEAPRGVSVDAALVNPKPH